MSKNKKCSDEQFTEMVAHSFSIAQVLRKMDLNVSGANYKMVKMRVEQLNLKTSHWTGQGHGSTVKNMIKRNTIPIEEILVDNSTYTNTSCLKKRLIAEDVIKNKCMVCGQDEMWNNNRLVMVLDHINGNNRDHRIENLRLLCPNCNSQQSTFAGRNKKKDKKIYTCHKCGKILKCERPTGMCIHCVGALKKNPNKIKNKTGVCLDCGAVTKGRSNVCIKCSHKKNRIVPRPSYEDLKQDIKNMSWLAVSKKYGVSDNAIRKWIKNYEKDLF